MHHIRSVLVVSLAVAVLGAHTRAQEPFSLPIALFERYLDALRQQTGIPGMSGLILQEGKTVWEVGLGHQDVDRLVRATPDTPYPLLGITQTIASTILLEECYEHRAVDLGDTARRWNSSFPDESTTVRQLLAHSGPNGFDYDSSRFAALTTVTEQCARDDFPSMVVEDALGRLGMTGSVPGHDLDDSSPSRRFFSSSDYSQYTSVLGRVAVPYKVDSSRRATRADYSKPSLSAATGIVSTVRDLARFDRGLDEGALIDSNTRNLAWQPASSQMGLGWFAGSHNGERVVWHFGLARDAYSGLYLKVPGRKLTLILLANSDGLAAPYTLSNGDLSASLFAQLFLKLFVS